MILVTYRVYRVVLLPLWQKGIEGDLEGFVREKN